MCYNLFLLFTSREKGTNPTFFFLYDEHALTAVFNRLIYTRGNKY